MDRARLEGMANISELLINIVKPNEPKKLTGSGQNGNAEGQFAMLSNCTDYHSAGE
ncbi:hypothetical protein GCM10011339_35640 [Echinicola rosea]|uniref:Uncharacterized protein n=1 Tax=Echinicola rosea TaxID=1807691 RepID=A0ABQ1VAW0_9BACT|nr:hypothetical protein GCM10011339_35640 [Echinicola rosea]